MGGDTHPLHSSLIPPEKLHKLRVSGPPQLDLPLPVAEPDIPDGGDVNSWIWVKNLLLDKKLHENERIFTRGVLGIHQ